MNDTKYNGWTNRATWLVNVWGNPESKDDVRLIKGMIEDLYDELPNGIIKDMVRLSEIDWGELESHFKDGEAEEE